MSKKPKAKVGHKPPKGHVKHTTKNSWTSPSKIARRKRIAEALAWREKGYSFPRIASEMRISISTAHDYVVEGIAAIPTENARQVLAVELDRIDRLTSVHYPRAVAGDLPAAEMVLKLGAYKSRLLGLFPMQGSMSAVLVAAGNSTMGTPAVEFIVPGFGSSRGPVDGPAPEPERRPERLLEPPRERYPTPFGVVEVEGEVIPPAGPRTELDAPQRYEGGESRRWGRSAKSTDWMGS